MYYETITKLPLLLQSRNFAHDFVSPPRRTLAKYGFVVLPRPAQNYAISRRRRVL